MQKKFLLPILFLAIVSLISCNDDDKDEPTPAAPVTAAQVLNDFAYTLAIPNYADLQAKANTLNQASITLQASTTDQNLQSARDAWRAVRQAWEQAEGYLFGPVSDFDYDPKTDSWPVNTNELDALLNDLSNPLEVTNIDSLQFTLKGYHPIEYVLFGTGGTRTVAELDARKLKYLTSLTTSLYNTLTELVNSWDPSLAGNFTLELTTAGTGSARYATRKDAFLEIVNAMGHICDEVANGKMQVPLVTGDSTMVESQYAHNATTDFTNNIRGVENVYLCRYSSTGKSLSDLVRTKNISLDNEIKSKISASLNALSVINPDYGHAIFSQTTQIASARFSINELLNEMNLLTNFVQDNINE
jgi:putative iron-regulated protein